MLKPMRSFLLSNSIEKFIGNKKTNNWQVTTGLQLPVVLPITSSSNAKIPHKNALVKYDDHNDGVNELSVEV